MAELIVYPDADPEVVSMDAQAQHAYASGSGENWATIIVAPGTSGGSSHGNTLQVCNMKADSDPDKWWFLRRGMFLFDTSALIASASIVSATLTLFGSSKLDQLGVTPNVNIYACDPALDTENSDEDFSTFGDTPLCDTPISYADWLTSAVGNDFVLNAAGLAAISKTGITKLGTRNVNYDVNGVAPAWTIVKYSGLYAYTADNGLASLKPKLVINYYPTALPSDDVARVSSIRHIFQPGVNRMQVGIGDLGFDVDVAEAAIRKIVTAALETGQLPEEPRPQPVVIDCPPGYHMSYDAWDVDRQYPFCVPD